MKWCCVFLLLNSFALVSQNYLVCGKVRSKNESLPFASITIKGKNSGTSSNSEGAYEMRLPAGHYTLVFQYIGYRSKTIEIELNKDRKLDIELELDGISLEEVSVIAGEDPAYPIIRQAIARREYYLKQVDSYSCQVYVKGLQRLLHVPEQLKKLVKMRSGETLDSNQLGILYLSESESNYFFKAPDKEKEILYSSKISGASTGFSYNQFNQIRFDFNENLVDISGISDRPFISPLHDQALLFYRYRLVGSYEEGGTLKHKIAVKAKQSSSPCFEGYIYIQDQSWRLSGLDLQLTKAQNLKFVDTLQLRQIFAPVSGDSVWMAVNHYIGFSFRFMGVVGDGYGNASLKKVILKPVFEDGLFNNEILRIEEEANRKDSAYWALNRPVPLTSEEQKDYRKKDSVERLQSTDRYKDSVDRVRNRFRPAQLFFGYTYHSTRNRVLFSSPGLLSSGIQYNTVEGVNLIYNFDLQKSYEDERRKSLHGKVRYGFGNALWGGELGFTSFFKPKHFSRYSIKARSIVQQFNVAEPITPLVNSLYTLLANENYMKLFKETALEGSYFSEIYNGVFFNSILKYAQRDPLKNSSDNLWIDDKSKLFSSNDPQHKNTEDSAFSSNRALTVELSFSFRFDQKYFSRPNQKIIMGSKYPRLNISYRKAIPLLYAITNYDLISLMVYDDVKLGLFGTLGYRFRGGGFVNRNTMSFMDHKHFLGNQTIFNTNDYLNSYRLLPYYDYSADHWYAEAHAEHHFNGLLFNAIPLIKTLRIQEVIGLHALFNNKLEQYYELNFGIENLFGLLRIDYVLAYGLQDRVRSGFTIGLNTRL